MARRDGTGPLGLGQMTGRGLGNCSTDTQVTGSYGAGYGQGAGRGRGAGAGFGLRCRGNFGARNNNFNDKESLEQERTRLENRLSIINRQLEK